MNISTGLALVEFSRSMQGYSVVTVVAGQREVEGWAVWGVVNRRTHRQVLTTAPPPPPAPAPAPAPLYISIITYRLVGTSCVPPLSLTLTAWLRWGWEASEGQLLSFIEHGSFSLFKIIQI